MKYAMNVNNTMNLVPIIGGLIIVAILIIGVIILLRRVLDIIDYKNTLKNRELDLQEQRMYLEIDTEELEKEIIKMIDKYINFYVLYNFVNEERYIGEKESKEMVTSITRTVYLHLSPVYRQYIMFIRNIKNDDDILIYLRDIIKERALLYIVDHNTPQ